MTNTIVISIMVVCLIWGIYDTFVRDYRNDQF